MSACALAVEGLDCDYTGPLVVRGATFSLAPGEKGALIGGNGCGKSTLLRAVAGLHTRATGTVRVDAMNPLLPSDRRKILHRIAWMPQRHPAGGFPFRVRELLASRGAPLQSRHAAQQLGITHLLDRAMTDLSGGQRQRAYLAWALGALETGAGLLLADEPTSALDFDGQALVADLLLEQPATMLVVTHDPAMAERFDRVFHMADGVLRPDSVLRNDETLVGDTC